MSESENKGQIIVYANGDRPSIKVSLQDENIWLTQRQMAELFDCSTDNISLHLKNIFESGELSIQSTTEIFSVVQNEGNREVTRNITCYNLDVIIAVGYRVNSKLATAFRQWATKILREYIIKGFALDDERLKNPSRDKAQDYFDELLERIRDIRASEKRMYLRVREIFALSSDYRANEQDTIHFFQHMQDKLHYAATQKTAAEIIYQRADSSMPNMGITAKSGDEIRKKDVVVAKNYLNEQEIDTLNRIVVMWLDYAELQAQNKKQILMREWEEKLDKFLEFNEREVLENFGSVSRSQADGKAKGEHEKFNALRRQEKETIGEVENIKALENIAQKQIGKTQ